MSLPQSRAADGRPIAPVYGVWDGEMLIDAPAKTVWRHILNYPSWQNYALKQHVAGTPGGEGEIVLLRKEEQGFEFPPYYALTIQMDPERRMIWKTWPEKGTQEVDFFGIVEFNLDASEGKTRFRYHTLYEFLVPYREERELEVYRQQQIANFNALLATIFPKLKKLSEESR